MIKKQPEIRGKGLDLRFLTVY